MSKLLANLEAGREKAQARDGVALRPRVLHLVTSFEIGGTERQVVELLKRLDPKHYDVRLAAIRNEGPLYRDIAARFPKVPEFPLTSFYDANAARQLARLRALLVREQVDILHTHGFYDGLLGVAAARLAGVRAIAAQRHLRLSDRRLHDWGQRLIHRLADRLLVNSEAVRDHVVADGCVRPEKITVIRNGLVAEGAADGRCGAVRAALCRELRLDGGAKLIGAVAKLRPEKGHRYLLEAAARVTCVEPRAHFVLVGDGPLRGEIEGLVAGLGLAGRVHLLGDRADAAQLVSGFDLAVLASLHEGLPNAVLEAMAVGVPVVATAVGGIAELIADGETGYLAPAADPEALASRIAAALADEVGSRAMAERGRRFVTATFGMRRMIEEVACLYDEVLAGR